MERQHFITPDALERRLGQNNLSIICNFMYLPTENRDGAAEFAAERIPGAVYFDLDEIADQSSSLPHMIANPDQFSRQLGALGVNNNDEIIVYDGPGLFSSARIWWNLHIMGAKNVRILEGGYNRWKKENRPTDTSEPAKPQPAEFEVSFEPDKVVNADQVLAMAKDGSATILDARSSARFAGEAPEPRKGLRLGHIPGSNCLAFTDLIKDGTLINNNRLQEIINPLIEENKPIITTCGSGVTAAVLSLALTCIGRETHALYDGSWTEWGGADGNFPIVTGNS